jgi:hypothetical protein
MSSSKILLAGVLQGRPIQVMVTAKLSEKEKSTLSIDSYTPFWSLKLVKASYWIIVAVAVGVAILSMLDL